jgi:hypothetical protein
LTPGESCWHGSLAAAEIKLQVPENSARLDWAEMIGDLLRFQRRLVFLFPLCGLLLMLRLSAEGI